MFMTNSKERSLALVTGASSGIDYELARLFAADGSYLMITATNIAGLERTAEALRAAGVSAEIVTADLINYQGTEVVYAAIQATR